MFAENRFYDSNGKPIILAETRGHARVELTQVRGGKHDLAQSKSKTKDEDGMGDDSTDSLA